MLNFIEPLLGGMALCEPDFTPPRYGLLAACDGGMLEVSGLSVPIGTQCRIAHGAGSLTAETIGFRNGRTLMMLLGDPVLLRPGAKVRPEGRPGMVPVGEA
ncbi:MAG: flagellum-specific ATP synthase FliI, partial [Novosphingobium sp.]|nr:flagellum-specific ATP synthase FliI [Novosphingobium sp.]